MPITPEQCRAARALIGWSQDDLEAASRVAKKSIADFERGAAFPYDKTLREIEFALEAAGVELIPENGGGAGVRLKIAVARLSRKRISRFDRIATFVITYKSREIQVRLSTNILDDVDRANHSSDAELEKSADRHMNMILVRAAIAIDAGREEPRGIVLLTNDDFPEVS